MEKIKLEDNIMEKMRSQLTLDKAAQYTKKMTDKLRRRATELVRIISLLMQFYIQLQRFKEKYLEVYSMYNVHDLYMYTSSPSNLDLHQNVQYVDC